MPASNARQPGVRYPCHDITVTAGTTKAAPLVTDVSDIIVQLLELSVVTPAGPSGAVGWQLRLSGSPIIPWQNTGLWIVEDSTLTTWDVDLQVDQTLQVYMYNLGAYDHTYRFRLKVADLASPGAGSQQSFTPLDFTTSQSSN